jgi:hypothetical protein
MELYVVVNYFPIAIEASWTLSNNMFVSYLNYLFIYKLDLSVPFSIPLFTFHPIYNRKKIKGATYFHSKSDGLDR